MSNPRIDFGDSSDDDTVDTARLLRKAYKFDDMQPYHRCFFNRDSIYYNKSQFLSEKEADIDWSERHRWYFNIPHLYNHGNFMYGIRIPKWCLDATTQFSNCALPRGSINLINS